MKCLRVWLSVRQYSLFLVFATTIFASGCAHSPLMKEWDWGIRPDAKTTNSNSDQQLKLVKKELKRIYKENPTWRKTSIDEAFSVEYYDSSGRKIGSAAVE